jgi:hypothetical protein
MQPLPGWVQRVALAGFAAFVCAWLVASLIASREIDKANKLARTVLVRPISNADVADVRHGLHEAQRFNADDVPLYTEAALLVVKRRYEEALPVAERLVRQEPENFDGWNIVYGATRHTDFARARLARRRALQLNPLARSTLPPVDPAAN